LLDPAVRAAQSGWSFVPQSAQDRFVTSLTHDLQSGAWDREHGAMRHRPTLEGSLRLVISRPSGS
jgi:hypothetical protein